MGKQPSKQQQPELHGRFVATKLSYQGVIPLPEHVEQYERIAPGFANRLLAMAEQESAHRRQLEAKNLSNSFWFGFIGVTAALIGIGMVCFLCYYAFTLGYPTAAGSIACTVIVGLIAAFIGKK